MPQGPDEDVCGRASGRPRNTCTLGGRGCVSGCAFGVLPGSCSRGTLSSLVPDLPQLLHRPPQGPRDRPLLREPHSPAHCLHSAHSRCCLLQGDPDSSMEYRSSSLGMGLWVLRKLHQVPSSKGNNSCEGDCSPSLGPYRSVALPGKTQGLGISLVALISNPEVELVDSPSSLEVRSLLGLAVEDETAPGGVDHPVPFVACGAN